MNTEFGEILMSFEPITLQEMDGVKLMDRTDTKFVFRIEKLAELLPLLQPDYKVLVIDECRISDYETVYYDTDDFYFFQQHQRGKANRQKVRIRTYLSSNQHFLEVKTKNNKSRTIKERIKSKEEDLVLTKKVNQFLDKQLKLDKNLLHPKITVRYSRITLVHKSIPSRLTIDIALQFQHENQQKKLFEIAIAELKREKSGSNDFSRLLHSLHIYKGSFSKYCFGLVFLYKNLKINNFKQKIQTLNKILSSHSL